MTEEAAAVAPAAGGAVPRRSLVRRVIGAALLDGRVYDEVKQDRSAGGQAIGMMTVVTACAAAGALGRDTGMGPLEAAAMTLAGWAVFSLLAWYFGTRSFGGTATPGQLFRTLAFAQEPGVLVLLSALPYVGGFFALLSGGWRLLATLAALERTLAFGYTRALFTFAVAGLMMLPAVLGASIAATYAWQLLSTLWR
ncbi:MAG TPA: hypothetical protein VFS20_30020 [Longimicrobium sp.]|nr:hypothetical protein [Longimicrobium sp.]